MDSRRPIDDVVDTLKNAKARKRGCTLLVGAGCSVKAGIPTAAGFVDVIKERFPQAHSRALDKVYPRCMAELAMGQRRDLIADYVDRAKINWAHIGVAQLMKHGFIDRILTTNFGSDIHVMLALRRSPRQGIVTNKQLHGTDMVGELLRA